MKEEEKKISREPSGTGKQNGATNAPTSASDLAKKKKIWEFKPVRYLDMSNEDHAKEYSGLKNQARDKKIMIEWEQSKWVTSPLETAFYICIFYAEIKWIDDDSGSDAPIMDRGEMSEGLSNFREKAQHQINDQMRKSKAEDVDGEIDIDDVKLGGFETPPMDQKSPENGS